ncbi:guanylate-binding protein 2-like [Mya arenaria]|nr:guanylate-binding protein 2-like [Mya arenaria]
MPDSKIEPDFLQRLNDLHQYLCHSSPKKLKSGKPVNGRMLKTMIISYMKSVKENTAPCLADAMKLMADEENQFAVRKASECYQEEMMKRISKHMPDEKELERYHNECMDIAVNKLKELVVVNDSDIFNRKAAECFKSHLERFKSIVEKDSIERCRIFLKPFDKKIQQKIREKKYAHSHGYSEYFEDINTLADEFTKHERNLGSKARSALQEYMDAKVKEEQLVYEMVKDKIGAESERQLDRLSPGSLVMPMKFEDVTKEEHSGEKKALESFKMIEMDGLVNIGSQILENLEMKFLEIEKAKAELSEDDTYYKQLVAEYDDLKNIYEQAKFPQGPQIPKPIPKPKPIMPGKGEQANAPKGKETPKCPIL